MLLHNGKMLVHEKQAFFLAISWINTNFAI